MSAATENEVLQCPTFVEYLKSFQSSLVTKLYSHPPACMTVYRELTHYSQIYVSRLIFLDLQISEDFLDSWIKNDHNHLRSTIIEELTSLHILDVTTQSNTNLYILNETFKQGIKTIIAGGGDAWMGVAEKEPVKHIKDEAFLESYARERWESVLHYMVGSKDNVPKVSKDIVNVLLHARLIHNDPQSNSPFITSLGFQFLLLDTSSQVWFLITKYLAMAHSKGLDVVECLKFLCTLNIASIAKAYGAETNPNLSVFLQHLREFGLVFQRTRKVNSYYPTKLAIHLLTSSAAQDHLSTYKQHFMLVEAGNRFVAYTNSSLQICLISLFCHKTVTMDSMVCGVITRESCSEAFNIGITAQQIIQFLKTHSHPEAIKKYKRPLLEVVEDQIRLWEMERKRLKSAEAVLYKQFNCSEDFQDVYDYAKEKDVLVWSNSDKRLLVVSKEGHDDVRKYWKKKKKRKEEGKDLDDDV